MPEPEEHVDITDLLSRMLVRLDRLETEVKNMREIEELQQRALRMCVDVTGCNDR
jgi:hypothetical protein